MTKLGGSEGARERGSEGAREGGEWPTGRSIRDEKWVMCRWIVREGSRGYFTSVTFVSIESVRTRTRTRTREALIACSCRTALGLACC